MGDPPEFVDPFTSDTIRVKAEHYKFYKTLLRKDAYYVVICPGSIGALHAIQQSSQFENYPFVPDDEDLSIARSMKLNMSSTEIWPGIIHISQNSLSMFPIYIGRGPGNYGIPALLKSLSDERSKYIYKAYQAIKDASYQVDRIRRKLRKWQPLLTSRQTQPTDTSLPSELWLDIMDWIPDVRDVMKMREVSMAFNVVACEVIICRLRANAKHLASCVPPQENIEFDTQVINDFDRQLNPYDDYDRLPGLGELRKQVEIAEQCSSLVNRWVRNARPSLNI
ncbi:hypothetical protein VKS41_008604 [Umbelopsis sp. WA50703]